MSVQTPLYDRLLAFAAAKNKSFHVPGHKHGQAYQNVPEFSQLAEMDVTELPGLDDLHQPDGVIAEAQMMAAALFHAEETYFLVNGSTVGNLALIMTVCAPGDLMLVQRNAHKSVINGLTLAGAHAVFLQPDFDADSATALALSTETIRIAIRKYPQAKALFLTNPTYYGATIDLHEISRITHEADMALLVDEAHGAHFGFHSAWPSSAMQTGADASVQSTHKMLTSLTMTGMLHVQGNRVDRGRLRQILSMLQSSSPSYVLMASLDLARAYLAQHIHTIFQDTFERTARFREQVQTLSATMKHPYHVIDFSATHHNYLSDPCKLVLQRKGVTGLTLQRQLQARKCFVELADERNVLLSLSVLTSDADLHTLLHALLDISQTELVFDDCSTTNGHENGIINVNHQIALLDISEPLVFSLDELHAHTNTKMKVTLEDALGSICAEALTPYPPGIPLLLPGERFESQHVNRLLACVRDGLRVHGLMYQEEQCFVHVWRPGWRQN